MSRFNIFVDVETTGFDTIRNDVTSIGAVVTDGSFNTLEEFYTTVRPELNQFTSDKALEVSMFTRETLMQHKPQREACIDFMYFLKPYLSTFPQTMISHTVNNFDWRFIDGLFRKQDLNFNLYKILRHDYQESTIKLARSLGHTENKLSDWAIKLELDFNHHNALDDARVCMEIYKWLSDMKT